MGLRPTRNRQTAATVMRRLGAWLISWEHGDVGDIAGPVDLYDCASSLATAKRVAVEDARRFGYEGAVRWSETVPGRVWTLEMAWPADEWDGEA